MLRFVIVLLAFAFYADLAEACSYGPNYVPPTTEQRHEALRRHYQQSDALVEVIATRASTFDGPGRMRVLRVYKGNIAVGSELSVRSFVPTSCGGAGNYTRGARGLLLIRRVSEPLFYNGFLTLEEFGVLYRANLLATPRHR